MQLPREISHFLLIARFGRYVGRRLRRAGKAGLAKDTLTAVTTLRTKGRAWEDTDDAVQDAMADRDACDDDLDAIAQEARNGLAGRGVSAAREEPYTLIFQDGIGYYIAAPLDEEVTRYTELSERLTAHLPAADPIRKSAVPAIKKGIAAFKVATSELDGAERLQAHARTDLDRAIRGLLRQLEKVYGLLMADEGKSNAEAFFPKTRTAKAKPNAKDPTLLEE